MKKDINTESIGPTVQQKNELRKVFFFKFFLILSWLDVDNP